MTRAPADEPVEYSTLRQLAFTTSLSRHAAIDLILDAYSWMRARESVQNGLRTVLCKIPQRADPTLEIRTADGLYGLVLESRSRLA